ncbi:MAG: cobalamin-dependent protein [Sedimentibacter sp.]|uniref:B12-binding domain-containing radical SAM protein n=1 Tax=Sedimentibacter sp. TaxID=1960295 RepID=UPI0031587BF1
MRILLVRPPRIKQAITLSDFMFSEPIGLEMVYGVLKEDYDVEIFDMMIETVSLSKKIEDYNPRIVGLTSLCIDVNKVVGLCAETKKVNPDIITVVGGTQTYLNPEAFFHESVDHVFEYTCTENLRKFYSSISIGNVELIDGIRSKALGYESTGKKGRNEYLLPDRSSTEKYRSNYSYFGYRPAAIMEFGTGCEKVCDFCLRWRIEGVKEKLIDPELTKKDLASIKEPTIMFMDNDFFGSEEKIRTFINLIKELNLKKNYIMYGSVKGIIEFKELVGELAGLGLKALLVGYETHNDNELVRYHKQSTTTDNHEAAKILRDLGIDVWASFMAHPDWSKNDFILFRSYIKGLKPQITSISPLTPFPNLPMYEQYKNRLIYKSDDYEKWSFGQVMIKPSQVSLRTYYYELLKTNLYVNIFINKNTEMIKKFGIRNIFRIFIGSIKAAKKYVALMIEN